MLNKDLSFFSLALVSIAASLPGDLWAASPGSGNAGNGSLLIPLFVIGICVSIIALQWYAGKQWLGWWRRLAVTPLFVLLLWVAIIIAGKAMNPASHALWTIEIFAWSMITPVYTAILITAKKALAKADQGLS